MLPRHRQTVIGFIATVNMMLGGCRGTTLAPGDVSPASCRRHVAHPPLDRLRIDTLVIGFRTTAPGSFTTRLTLFDPLANLSITRGGRVYYTYESRPGTGSGGQAIAKEWDIPADEAGRLLDAVVADGLLDQPDVTPGGTCGFIVTSGRWQMRGSLASMPPAILARLRPYLEAGNAAFREKYGAAK